MALTDQPQSRSEWEKRIERKLDLLLAAAEITIEEEINMDAAGEALQAKITALDADVTADNEAVVKGGEAIASAGTKFGELKALIEKQASGGALTDEEATTLTTLAGEVDSHLTAATTELDAHITQLGEETAAA